MRLPSGKRLGQSGNELVLAVFFSFFVHSAFAAAALILSFSIIPRKTAPPVYHVKLVGQPVDISQPPPSAAAPVQPKKEPPPKAVKAAKPKMTAHKTVKAPATKGAIPELTQKKQKPQVREEEVPEEVAMKPAAPETPSKSAAEPQKSEGVAVGSTSQDFKFPPYLAIVREKISRNWNPPPGASGITAKVVFQIVRSGRVERLRLEVSSKNFYFDQAAMRAIRLSDPFPPLPEGVFKGYEEFSVDLMEKE